MANYSDTSEYAGLGSWYGPGNPGPTITSTEPSLSTVIDTAFSDTTPALSDTVTTDTVTETASVPSKHSVKKEIIYSEIPFITNIYPYDYDYNYPLSTYRIRRRKYKDSYYNKVYNKYHSNLFVYDEDLDDLTDDTLNYTVSEKPKKKKGTKKKGSKKKGSKKKGSKKKGKKKR
tara:strand:+ start:262 stop:783 length:522 start_codon:yes stop_codon:yes gene_type:complete